MQPTAYPQVNDLLNHLLNHMQAILGDKLVGLYLYGSLVTGNYDDTISDVDLLAAIASDLTETEYNALDHMHQAVVAQRPQWDDRIEIAYLSTHALQTFKTESSEIAIISPGEPFNRKQAGIDWLMNWYVVRASGLTLYGPPSTTLIAPTSQAEYVQAVKDYLIASLEWLDHVYARPYQAYTILTMCRGLYTWTHGEPTSKIRAAAWAQQEMPQWASTIQNALAWRLAAASEKDVDHAATLAETRRFVHFVIDKILAGA